MNPTVEIQKKPKYRPQVGSESQDILINFELTQQNMLGSWNKDPFHQQMPSKSPLFNLNTNDDLMYSDNENDETEQLQVNQKESSTPQNGQNIQETPTNKQKVLVDRINLVTQPSREKKMEKTETKLGLQINLKKKIRRSRTQETEQLFQQNKSCCFLNNKSVFFHNANKTNPSNIVFRVRPRPDIRQLVEIAHKTERRNQ